MAIIIVRNNENQEKYQVGTEIDRKVISFISITNSFKQKLVIEQKF